MQLSQTHYFNSHGRFYYNIQSDSHCNKQSKQPNQNTQHRKTNTEHSKEAEWLRFQFSLRSEKKKLEAKTKDHQWSLLKLNKSMRHS